MHLPISSRLGNVGVRFYEYFSIELSSKTSMILILIITAVLTIDSTIARFFSYSGVEFPSSLNVTIFIIFSIVFAISGFILLNSVRKNSQTPYRLPNKFRYFHDLVMASQILLIGIILAITLQMTFLNGYNLALLQISTYVTHASALIFLISLVCIFVGWLKLKRNYIVVLYTISFSLISVTILISMIYLEYRFSLSLTDLRKPYPINSYVIRQEATIQTESLSTTFDVLSLSSFFTIWIATLTLLYQYKYKLGRIKFFTFMSIPLVYYLFPFESYFGNALSPLVLSSPVTFGIIYVLTFSATKQVGALLFSLAFITGSILVTKDRVRKSLLISAIGIAILFSSIEIATLQYRLYPPFGLITEAFMPLGAYLLFIGIFTSATSVSRDAKLRKEFYKSAMSQFNLLKTIGVTQMEKELLKEYKPVLARSNELEEPRYQPLEQSDVKEIIRDVLQEIQSRQNSVAKDDTK